MLVNQFILYNDHHNFWKRFYGIIRVLLGICRKWPWIGIQLLKPNYKCMNLHGSELILKIIHEPILYKERRSKEYLFSGGTQILIVVWSMNYFASSLNRHLAKTFIWVLKVIPWPSKKFSRFFLSKKPLYRCPSSLMGEAEVISHRGHITRCAVILDNLVLSLSHSP